MLMAKTNPERLMMGLSMNKMAREMVLASILAKNPHITHNELRREIFLRFYKNDFPASQIQNILPTL